MGKSLTEIAQQLKDTNKKVQLIYAFNGTGKTRLSKEFKRLVDISNDEIVDDSEKTGLELKKVLYYNAFTEDLFHWDNDLDLDSEPKLKIQPNSFTKWIFEEQGQDRNIITNFQHYTSEKLTPHFNEDFSEITFSFERGNKETSKNIKISKGEESNLIWSIFYSLLEQIIEILNIAEPSERETNKFDELEYVFIDDPVSSLDENHLIELAVDLAQLIKLNNSEISFIITTHNPLFYNVLYNELNSDNKTKSYKKKFFERYRLEKQESGTYKLINQTNDSPFSYHLYLKSELEKAIETGQLNKFHFNFLRNILEKTSTFLGYEKWGDLLPKQNDGGPNPYKARIINISSHSKHAGEEVTELTEDDKRVLRYLVNYMKETYKFK